MRLLHDGQISAEVGIEDFVEAHEAQGADHLAGYRGARLVAESFADRRANGRRRLYNHVQIGIFERAENILRGIVFQYGRGRARVRALPAWTAP